jgi:hypothetical protein
MAAQTDTASFDVRAASPERDSAAAKLGAGIVAGIIGGILMLGCLMGYAHVTGAGWDTPLKALGAFVYGLESYVAGPVSMAAGAAIQLGFSIVVGILFALCVSRSTSTIASMISGIVLGAAIWVAMELAVLPFWNPTMASRMALMPMAYLGAHILYGIGLGTTPILIRTFAKERHTRAEVYERRRLNRLHSASQ